MHLISWNIAGIKACIKKGLINFIQKQNADFYCFQEVKSSSSCLSNINYHVYSHTAEKKGYSGVVTLTKHKPLNVIYGLNNPEIDSEGRVLTLEFNNFYLINAYFPHAHRELTRLEFKLHFNKEFEIFCSTLSKSKPLIIAADFNVAHTEIDLRNPKQNKKNAGFTEAERSWFDTFLKSGYTDTFRMFTTDPFHYTWWPYRSNCRQRNIGWRIDYFVTSNGLKNNVKSSIILKDILGSDHCPVGMKMCF